MTVDMTMVTIFPPFELCLSNDILNTYFQYFSFVFIVGKYVLLKVEYIN